MGGSGIGMIAASILDGMPEVQVAGFVNDRVAVGTQIGKYKVVDGIKCFSPDVANAYANYPESGYGLMDRKSFWFRSRNRLFGSFVRQYARAEGKTRFLEIGCGRGDFIRQISGNANLEITGSEIYLKGLLRARKELPGIEFIQLDVTRDTLNGQFDIIAAFDVIEHIEDDAAAISNINRMLRRGGVLIMTVPQHMFLWGRLDEFLRHRRRYSRRELAGKLAQNGFAVARCTSFVFVLFPLMLISRLFDRGCERSQPDEASIGRRINVGGVLNWILDFFMRIDEALIRLGLSLPFGGTLLVVARKV